MDLLDAEMVHLVHHEISAAMSLLEGLCSLVVGLWLVALKVNHFPLAQS